MRQRRAQRRHQAGRPDLVWSAAALKERGSRLTAVVTAAVRLRAALRAKDRVREAAAERQGPAGGPSEASQCRCRRRKITPRAWRMTNHPAPYSRNA